MDSKESRIAKIFRRKSKPLPDRVLEIEQVEAAPDKNSLMQIEAKPEVAFEWVC